MKHEGGIKIQSIHHPTTVIYRERLVARSAAVHNQPRQLVMVLVMLIHGLHMLRSLFVGQTSKCLMLPLETVIVEQRSNGWHQINNRVSKGGDAASRCFAPPLSVVDATRKKIKKFNFLIKTCFSWNAFHSAVEAENKRSWVGWGFLVCKMKLTLAMDFWFGSEKQYYFEFILKI